MKIIIYDKELKELVQKHVKGRMGINITLADISFNKTDNFGIDTTIFIRKPGTTTFPAELSSENERYEEDLSAIQLRKQKKLAEELLKPGEYKHVTDEKTGKVTLVEGQTVSNQPELENSDRGRFLTDKETGEKTLVHGSKEAFFRLSLEAVELEQALVMLENVNSDEDPIRVLDKASFDPEVSSPNDLDILFPLDTKAKDININFYGKTSKGDQWMDGTLADMIFDRTVEGETEHGR